MSCKTAFISLARIPRHKPNLYHRYAAVEKKISSWHSSTCESKIIATKTRCYSSTPFLLSWDNSSQSNTSVHLADNISEKSRPLGINSNLRNRPAANGNERCVRRGQTPSYRANSLGAVRGSNSSSGAFIRKKRNAGPYVYDGHYDGDSHYPYYHDDDVSARIIVKSVHAARTIDVVSVFNRVFNGSLTCADGITIPAPLLHRFGKSSVMMQLPPASSQSSSKLADNSDSADSCLPSADDDFGHGHHPSSDPLHVVASGNPPQHPIDSASMRYICIYRYGSVVFFNIIPRDAAKMLEEIKKFSTDPVASGFEQKEHFEVAIKPGMEEQPSVNPDFAIVQDLDMNTVAVISVIMGQTVAMDSYKVIVDELLATFAAINDTVKKTGNFTQMEKDSLFKVVAQNNSLFIDMVSKLGVLDRSDTAWNFSQYENIYQGMKEEFELDNRFEHIEFKLNMIQQNTKFFLEVLHNQKTQTLEWIIIILIAFECVLMSLDMTGMGSDFFRSLPVFK